MMVWAAISALTALAKDFKGLLLTRFFLGVAEAPYYPGALYILSLFYTRKEIATRISILYTGNILATAFAGLIAAGIFYGMDNAAGISGWQWLFILQGLVTFVIALIGCFILPGELYFDVWDSFFIRFERTLIASDFPHNTRWLNPEERALAQARVERDTVGLKGNTTTLKGFMQAAKDPLVWLFAFMQHMHLAANGFKNFVRSDMFPSNA